MDGTQRLWEDGSERMLVTMSIQGAAMPPDQQNFEIKTIEK